jgi:hypothetical protein
MKAEEYMEESPEFELKGEADLLLMNRCIGQLGLANSRFLAVDGGFPERMPDITVEQPWGFRILHIGGDFNVTGIEPFHRIGETPTFKTIIIIKKRPSVSFDFRMPVFTVPSLIS